MAKDIILGVASSYSWNKIENWVNSIRKSNFKGDVVIISTDMKKEVQDQLTKEGVLLELHGTRQPNGDVFVSDSNRPHLHVERFFHTWKFLEEKGEKYRYIIATDVRDVFFQSDPSLWLEKNLGTHSIVASSEGLKYENEPWGNKNMYDTLGPFFHKWLKEKIINNAGVIAGDIKTIKGLMILVFQLSINRTNMIPDQAMYNFLINTNPFVDLAKFTTNDDAWAIQLGTTVEAVKAGSGDIGVVNRNDNTFMEKYLSTYEDSQPIITEDGIVKNKHGVPFVIVHQWDRVPVLKKFYGEIENEQPGTIIYSTERR